MVDSSSDTTTWSYDTKRRLASVVDAMTRKTQWTYDARNNLYQTTDATNTICDTRLYTANGLLASVKDARSNLTQFTFDGFDRPNQTTYADSSFEQNVLYDANGNVLTARTRAGNQIINTFDALNRLSTKAPASEPTVTFGYDLASRLLSATKPTVSGDPSSGAFSRLYDTAGRFYTESYPDGKQVIFGLDSNGNATKLIYPDGYFVTRSYDQLNRLSNIFLNGATTAAAALTYDQLSRRTALTYNNGASSSYGYASPIVDDLTSIAHAFVGSSVTFGYTYNNDHEITVQSLTDNTYQWFPTAANVTYAAANAVNEYPTVGGTTYSYNGDGCLTSDGVLTLGYDTEDHLTSASKTGTTVSYVYDGFHRQAQKTATISGTTAKSRYIYSGWQRIADYDGTAGTLQNRYIYADGLDEPLMQVSSAGVVTYLHANAQGSVIGVSNSVGAVTSKNVYGTFGETSALAGTTFGFTGQRYDSDTGLYYMKNRYYSASVGRFLQPDPVGYKDGLNLYTYGGNNAVIYGDPLGLASVGNGGMFSLSASASSSNLAGTGYSGSNAGMALPALAAIGSRALPGIAISPGVLAGGASVLVGGVSVWAAATAVQNVKANAEMLYEPGFKATGNSLRNMDQAYVYMIIGTPGAKVPGENGKMVPKSGIVKYGMGTLDPGLTRMNGQLKGIYAGTGFNGAVLSIYPDRISARIAESALIIAHTAAFGKRPPANRTPF
jgi:RHS repeat-associated protein